MGVSDIAFDAMAYVKELGPLLLLVGAVGFADQVMTFLIKLVKSGKINFKS